MGDIRPVVKLNEIQKLFVLAYCQTLSVTKAIRIVNGLDPNDTSLPYEEHYTMYNQGTQLLANVNVKNAIKETQRQYIKDCGLTKEDLLTEIEAHIRGERQQTKVTTTISNNEKFGTTTTTKTEVIPTPPAVIQKYLHMMLEAKGIIEGEKHITINQNLVTLSAEQMTTEQLLMLMDNQQKQKDLIDVNV